MGQSCSRTLIDVIPDKETMMEIVEEIAAFEEKLKRGEQLTRAQEQEKKQVDKVTVQMKSLQKFHREKEILRPLKQGAHPFK